MNIRDKVGQRFMVRFYGPELTPTIRQFLIESRAGSVIHFSSNIESLEQITGLNRDLQDLAARNGLPPYMIGVDEEGGRVSRMSADGLELIAPSQMAQAAAGADGPALCAGAVARQLARLGFNLNFAPVADVNNNPLNPVIATRAYGSQPDSVAEFVASAVEAYLANGVAPCIKHFPGHGDTNVDSHLGLPVVAHDRERLDALELVPFRAAIQAGVPAIMSAHILYPLLEPSGLPATLSSFFLSDLLRGELGFNGLIFSDALIMDAIAAHYSLSHSTLLTLQAGADVAMPLGSLEAQRISLDNLFDHADQLDLDQSVARIMAFKDRFCQPVPLFTPAQIAQDVGILSDVARRSITSLEANLTAPSLPLSINEPQPVVLDFELPIATPVEESRRSGPLLTALLRERWPHLRYLSLPADTTQTTEAIQAAQDASLVIILARNALTLPSQAQLITDLSASCSRVIVVAARDPYDLCLVEPSVMRLATYGDPPVSIRALVEVLFGEVLPVGRMPVSLD